MARSPGRRPARDAVLPRRVHAPECPRPGGACQPPRGLRPADEGRRGNPPRGGREPETPRGRSRRAGGAAHLGPGPRAAPPRPLRRHPRRAGPPPEPLGRQTGLLLPPRPPPPPFV